MRIDAITLFPGIFTETLGASILRIAAEKSRVQYFVHNVRDWATDNYKKVDDAPYGGGPGMVLKVDTMVRCVRDVIAMDPAPVRPILTSPQGRPFKQADAIALAKEQRLAIIAGHYEGYAERIRDILTPDEISVGDFVLSGGELPALSIIDAVVRLLPGVLGSADSLTSESFTNGRLDFPQYTRPYDFEGHCVPDILLSGHHLNITRWRASQALERTRRRRPDLLGDAGAGH